ncbi:unnamed protein product [Orchesella dallaii]|uniref:Reverse transcriptase domain-containing protein n=1 Tax=Orchesella dallaii TaxID=48710 RepID=A0ABP1Q7T3_9HEXA
MSELSDTKKPYFIMGDFNMGRDTAFTQMKYLCKKYNAKQLISKPTRGNAILDLLITNTPEHCNDTSVIDTYISDHNAILTTLDMKRPKPEKVHIKYRAFKNVILKDIHADIHIYTDKLLKCNFTNLDDMYKGITDMVIDIFNKHALIRTKTFKQYPNNVKLSETTKRIIHKRNVARNNSNKNRNDSAANNYTLLNKQVKNSIKQDVKCKTQDDIKTKGIWPVLNKLTKCKSEVTTKFSANEINDHFASISNAPTKKASNTSHIHKPDERFTLRLLCITDIKSAWKKMKNKCSVSEDYAGINNRMMSYLMTNKTFCEVILKLFNDSFTQKYVPLNMKVAKIIAIKKKSNATNLSDLRPISILPVLSKLLEKCVFAQLSEFIHKNNILSNGQYGFRPDHNTEHVEIYMYELMQDMIKNNLCAIATFDIQKAFDTLPRGLLCDKLEANNIDSEWFKSYISDRNQYVINNNNESAQKSTHRGVPQGGNLSGLLFILFINDLITSFPDNNIVMYVDDSQSMYKLDKINIKQGISDISDSCNSIADWFTKNDLCINRAKTELLIHHNKADKHMANDISVNFQGTVIEPCNELKSLGLVKNATYSWEKHIKHIAGKCNKSLWLLRSVKHLLTSNQLKSIAEALILPNIRYMCTVWGSSTRKTLQPLYKIMQDATRIIMSRAADGEKKPDWLFPHEIYIHARSIIAYKSKIEKVPAHFLNIINEDAIYEGSTRAGTYSKIDPSKCTSAMQLSFTELWSKVPKNIRNIASIKAFSKAMKTHLLDKRISKTINDGLDLTSIEEIIESVSMLYRSS